MLKVGDNVGNLEFKDFEGRSYRLSDFSDKRAVVFFFYPRDFSPGCTRQACYFRDYYHEIKELNAEVFGISTDSPKKHKRFKERYNLPYPLIADSNRELSRKFGVRRFGGLLGNKRVTFILSPTGKVVDVFQSEFSMIAHVEHVIEVLKGLEKQK